jgi:histidyl-tRNA synthetase
MADAIVPCTGISVGVDRLFAGMESLGMLESGGTVTEVLIVNFASDLALDYQRLARDLRAAGINTTIYLGEDTSFRAQIAYAARQSIPIVLIYGPDDRVSRRVQVKDMRARSQTPVVLDAVADTVRQLLGR